MKRASRDKAAPAEEECWLATLPDDVLFAVLSLAPRPAHQLVCRRWQLALRGRVDWFAVLCEARRDAYRATTGALAMEFTLETIDQMPEIARCKRGGSLAAVICDRLLGALPRNIETRPFFDTVALLFDALLCDEARCSAQADWHQLFHHELVSREYTTKRGAVNFHQRDLRSLARHSGSKRCLLAPDPTGARLFLHPDASLLRKIEKLLSRQCGFLFDGDDPPLWNPTHWEKLVQQHAGEWALYRKYWPIYCEELRVWTSVFRCYRLVSEPVRALVIMERVPWQDGAEREVARVKLALCRHILERHYGVLVERVLIYASNAANDNEFLVEEVVCGEAEVQVALLLLK